MLIQHRRSLCKKLPISLSAMEKSGMGKNRLRNRCFMGALLIGVCWLFSLHRFILDGQHPVESSEEYTGNVPLIQWEPRHTLKSRFHTTEKFTSRDALSQDWKASEDVCAGRYVYVYDPPAEYHEGLLQDCKNLSTWLDMCKELMNGGLGEPMEDPNGVFSESGWYSTNQFNLEVIFHERVKRDECRTMDSSKANVLYVPFYAGLEVMPHLWDGANISHRDQVPLTFVEWLTSRPEWARMSGHDHFFVAGRVTWDFRRTTDGESDWGNKLLRLEAVINMTTLTIEASPWHFNDIGIPYPTYFHPSTDEEVLLWQDRVRNLERKALFSFAGAPRPEQDTSIRGQIMTHCKASEHCSLMECTKIGGKCHSPANVMSLFQDSHFCLQPPGDSYTRRSLFDSILAGCIPVFFHEYSAYTQYGWFFPAKNSSYSVFIHEDNVRAKNVSIEEVLLSYSLEQISEMRELVISLIPHIVYGHPDNKLTWKDAYELSVEGIVDRVREYQKSLHERAGNRLAGKVDQDILATKSRLDLLLRSGVRA